MGLYRDTVKDKVQTKCSQRTGEQENQALKQKARTVFVTGLLFVPVMRWSKFILTSSLLQQLAQVCHDSAAG